MSEPLISVLVLTYHPQKDALFSTLRSIVLQKDCDYEVIVCDDGSGEFYQPEIREFLDAHGTSYQILAHEENQGTVKNILDGVKAARGTYIKPISPGDYLYDAFTLRDIGIFMAQHEAKAAFGRMVFYACDPDLTVKNLTHPVLPEIYGAEKTAYPYRKALKQQSVYGDLICGASAIYEKTAFAQALETVAPGVRLAEDTVFQLFAAENTRIWHLDRLVVWYEHGTGVSTQKPAQRFTRIDEDLYRFCFLMAERFPNDPYIKRACHLWQLRKDGSRLQNLLAKLRPDKLVFSLRVKCRRKSLGIPQYNDEFFHQCHRAADETKG